MRGFYTEQVTGADKYKKEDMPIAATFVSNKPNLVVFIEAPNTRVVGQGSDSHLEKVENTGCRVRFQSEKVGGFLEVKNKLLLAKLMGHRAFEAVAITGFRPDFQADPTGFWRAQGYVEEVEVIKLVTKKVNPTFKDIDMRKLVGLKQKLDKETAEATKLSEDAPEEPKKKPEKAGTKKSK